jgi:ankyrin repeat protein
MDLFELAHTDSGRFEQLLEEATNLFNICKEDPEKFKLLVDQGGVDVNLKDLYRNTFLHYAIWKQPTLVEFLIRKGANVNARNAFMSTPLHWTEFRHATETLLRHGADIDAVNNEGYTPLDIACIDYKPEAIQVLYEHGSRRLPRGYRTLNKVIALYAGMCWKRSDVGGLPSHILLGYMV